jgi:Mlc titration factor MtfA (ptsG expression regulator)
MGWDEIIAANVPLAARLDPERCRRLRELVQIFVAEKWWKVAAGSS